YEKLNFQELTAGLDYILEKGGKGKEIYVDCASRDTYIYYTGIHPHKSKYAKLEGAYLFGWNDDNFPEIASKTETARSFYVFTGGSPELRERHLNEVRQVLHQTDAFAFAFCYVYTFQKQ
ncbi:MAG: hypothetical protein JNL13_04515, partial [Chitinophagaceae bacterium]|nr:hypothetical protein [Chitinophagaceae bacterium]